VSNAAIFTLFFFSPTALSPLSSSSFAFLSVSSSSSFERAFLLIDEIKSHAITIASGNGASEKSRLLGSSNEPLLVEASSPSNGHSNGNGATHDNDSGNGAKKEWGGAQKRIKKVGELTGEEVRQVGKVSRRVYTRYDIYIYIYIYNTYL
jgi:hypothetical protein